jgi:hypothetical protein
VKLLPVAIPPPSTPNIEYPPPIPVSDAPFDCTLWRKSSVSTSFPEGPVEAFPKYVTSVDAEELTCTPEPFGAGVIGNVVEISNLSPFANVYTNAPPIVLEEPIFTMSGFAQFPCTHVPLIMNAPPEQAAAKNVIKNHDTEVVAMEKQSRPKTFGKHFNTKVYPESDR